MEKYIIKTEEELKQFLEGFGKSFSFDTETTSKEIEEFRDRFGRERDLPEELEKQGLDYCLLEIEGLSLCDGRKACYIDLVNNKNITSLLSLLKPVFNNASTIVAHNIVFDMKVLHKYGVSLEGKKIYDTMIADHLILETRKHGLKFLAKELLGKEEVMTWKEAHRIGGDTFAEYATNDAIWTWELCMYQQPLLKKYGLVKLFREIEMPFMFVIFDMEINGMEVDVREVVKIRNKLKIAIEDFNMELHDMIGKKCNLQVTLLGDTIIIPTINFNSTLVLQKILFEDLGLEVVEKTKKKAISVGKATINAYKYTVPFVALLNKYKIAQKLLSSFFSEDGQIMRNLDADGKVRPNIRDIGTKTGRISANSPNLLQLPKSNDDFPIPSRSVFIAGEGRKMFTLDFCFSDDTEVLTEDGFMLFKDIGSRKVAQWDNFKISYVNLVRKIEYDYKGDMVHFHGDTHIDLLMTPEHRHLQYSPVYGKYKKVLANKLNTYGTSIQTGSYEGKIEENSNILKLVALIQADGSIRKKEYRQCHVWVSKQRKIKRIKEILDSLGIEYKEWFSKAKGNQTGFAFEVPEYVDEYIELESKSFKRTLLNLTIENKVVFLKELLHWDGTVEKKTYFSTNLGNCELAQELAVTSGFKSNYNINIKKNCSDGIERKPLGQVSLLDRQYTYHKTIHNDTVNYEGKVYCVEVPSGYIIVRRNNKVTVSGNCNQEGRLTSHLSGDKTYTKQLLQGWDAHLATANAAFSLGIDEDKLSSKDKDYVSTVKTFKNERQKAKAINFALPYGGTEYAVSKAMGVSKEEAKEAINKYYTTYSGIKKAMDKSKTEILETGTLRTMFGRLRHFEKIKNPYNGKFEYPDKAFRQAFNFKVQSSASDMMRLALIKTRVLFKENAQWDAKIHITVYDEGVFTCKEEYLKEASEKVKEVFETCIKLDVPIKSDIGVGNDYEAAK